MRDAHAVDHPRFRLRWLFDRGHSRSGGSTPAWFDDEELVPPGDRALYARVKHGLSAMLRAADREGTVLLPAYVPGGVTWAVLDGGFDVRYYPVNPDLSLPVTDVADRIDEVDPAAILFIHYFGFADEGFDGLASLARSRDTLVIEDCARAAFGRDHDGRLLGSTGDVALFCLHKTLPVPNGGLIVARHAPVPRPDGRRRERGTIPRVAALAVAHRLRVPLDPEPTIERVTEATVESVAPEDSGRSPGSLTDRGLARCRPESVQSARYDRYRTLRSLLVDDPALRVVTPPAPVGASPYGVAALAPDPESRQRYLRALRSRGLPCEAFTWPAVYRHDEVRSSSGAETLRDRLLVLPTHQELDDGTVERMASLIRAERESLPRKSARSQ
ncbi:DegT/DnrJ/EryC1/StrS family aminotransferase [Halorubrum sp. DTA98]|uniref:DegT/DnrJ/EryC1/StrS family aminotransferase n=1 Tax=Halorubrum sp. DTA98 TaxID=3402163 RepID=UPI003AB03CF0